jgi:hypothetical protein
VSEQSATIFFDAAQAALDCVCEQMDALADTDESYPGCPCLQIVPAGEPAIECCTEDECGSEGMLSVHVESIFPSDNFPNPTAEHQPCKANVWVAQIVVTVARCAPTMDEQGQPYPPADITANGLLMAKDQWAVVTALSCCLPDETTGLGKRKRRVMFGESRPLTSEGGCASFEVRAFVEAGTVCSCSGSGS